MANRRNPVQELKIGPYAGGVNTYSDVSAIADNEMTDCVNFDIDLDGSLKSRPPWKLLYGSSTTITSGSLPPDSHQLILGAFVYEGVQFVIFNSCHSGAYAVYIYYVGGPNDGIVAKIADGTYQAAIRYGDTLYLAPGPEGGNASLGTGQSYALATGLVTALPNMPRGYAACVYKDRLWISGRRGIVSSSRLFFSDLSAFGTFQGSSFFDIAPGDGDAVNDLIVYQDNLVILKDNKTYVLSYDQGPAQAVLTQASSTVGVMGRNCVVAYENSIFMLQYNEVYEMSNFTFTRISVKVPFEYDHTTPFEGQTSTVDEWWKFAQSLSLVGDRLYARFYNRLYVYHLRLRAWTRYESDDESINYVGHAVRLDNTNTDLNRGYESYVACSALGKVTDPAGFGSSGAWKTYLKIFVMQDRYESSITENGKIGTPAPVDISCSIITKAYDVGLSHRFKRLMHWGMDCITGRDVTGTLYPFSVFYKVTWGELHSYQWHQLNTWQFPVFAIPSTIIHQPQGAGLVRRFIRFGKSIRFRLVQFKVEMLTSGNSTDGPARLYSITSFIAAKQLAPDSVN
jgi:hypothetical protein